METIHLDTHVVAWLWQGEASRVRRLARRLAKRTVACSPAVVLELQLLHEIGRLRDSSEVISRGLEATIGLQTSGMPFAAVVTNAVGLTWCRDPFDRLIVADAMAAGCRLLTSDSLILEHSRIALEP